MGPATFHEILAVEAGLDQLVAARQTGFPSDKLAERAFQHVIVTGALHLVIGASTR